MSRATMTEETGKRMSDQCSTLVRSLVHVLEPLDLSAP